MQIPCRESTHEAPFSSLPSRNGSCLSRQDILGLEVDGMDQAVAYWQIYAIVRSQDCVPACMREHNTFPDDSPFQVSSL